MSSMKEVYMEYYPRLVKVLPMNDALFIAQLYAGRLLPGNTKEVIQSRHTSAEKVQCFLDDCIKPAFLDDESNDIFLALLKIMENSDNVVLKSVAKEIEKKIQGIVLLGIIFVDMICYIYCVVLNFGGTKLW